MIPGEEEGNIQYPTKDFKKTITTLSSQEMRTLQPYDNVRVMAGIAEIVMNQILNNAILPRLGVKSSRDTGVIYDIPSGQIIVWEPRVWCSKCNIKRAEFQYKDKVYCKDCIEDLKKTLPTEVIEPKKENGERLIKKPEEGKKDKKAKVEVKSEVKEEPKVNKN